MARGTARGGGRSGWRVSGRTALPLVLACCLQSGRRGGLWCFFGLPALLPCAACIAAVVLSPQCPLTIVASNRTPTPTALLAPNPTQPPMQRFLDSNMTKEQRSQLEIAWLGYQQRMQAARKLRAGAATALQWSAARHSFAWQRPTGSSVEKAQVRCGWWVGWGVVSGRAAAALV